MSLPFRANVSILLMNNQHQILLGERFRQKGIWQFPQGGVEEGDSLEETVLRELEEELGLNRKFVKIIHKLEATNKYSWEKIPPQFVGKYQGQDQTFWLVQCVDPAASFHLEQEHQEFQNIKWVDVDNILSIVESVRVPGYAKAIAEVRAYLENKGVK